jgi:hypothetical protein
MPIVNVEALTERPVRETATRLPVTAAWARIHAKNNRLNELLVMTATALLGAPAVKSAQGAAVLEDPGAESSAPPELPTELFSHPSHNAT